MAVEANLAIQHTLTQRALHLEAQLKQLDDLIEAVHKGVATEEVPSDALGSEIQIPGAKRANGPFPSFELLSESSPFYKEASEREHYIRWTTLHPIKGKEAEVLADSVRRENIKLEAYRAQSNPSAPPIDIQNNVEGVNWSIVAERVSDNSSIKRTADECRIQWVGNLHPKVNHADWTQEELDKLHELTTATLAAGRTVNWVKVAKDLATNRIPLECMTRATTRPRHQWDARADQRLLEAVRKYGTNNWNLVAHYVSPYATTSQCQTRYVRSVDPSIKRSPWTSEEDTRLRKAVEAFGNSWIDVATILPGRTNEQCRERWSEVGAGEGGKGQWLEEEDQRLVDAVKELGNKWKMVSTRVGGGRTGPNCRLRYDRILKLRAKQNDLDSALEVAPAGASSSPQIPATANAANEPKPRRATRSRAPTSRGSIPTRSQASPSQSTSHERQLASNTGADLTAPRPRPKPRPVRKGKGKERATGTNVGPNLEAQAELGTQSAALGSSISVASEPRALVPLLGNVQLQEEQESESALASATEPGTSTGVEAGRAHDSEPRSVPQQVQDVSGQSQEKREMRGQGKRKHKVGAPALGESSENSRRGRKRRRTTVEES